MNLKLITDSLYLNPQTNKWEYRRINAKDLNSEQGLTFTSGTVYSYSNGVYGLMKVKKSGNFTADEVQDYLKNKLPNEKIIPELIDDLIRSFKVFLASVVIPDLGNLGVRNKQIGVDLKLIKSRSDLCRLIAEKIKVIQISDYTFNFSTEISFKKSKDVYFDIEGYKKDMKEQYGESYDEARAQKYGEDLDRRVKQGFAKGKGVHDILGHSERNLAKYIIGLAEKEQKSIFDALVTILLDDFVTSGSTLHSMQNEYRKVVKEGESALVYKVALFKK